jgi:hypothetical protein
VTSRRRAKGWGSCVDGSIATLRSSVKAADRAELSRGTTGTRHRVRDENNESALAFYRKRNFYKLDAAIFMAQRLDTEPELLPPRPLNIREKREG